MRTILVEVSARHIHLSRADMDVLFGEGSELHPIKDLSQPGQYASEEKVTLKGAVTDRRTFPRRQGTGQGIRRPRRHNRRSDNCRPER